mmetsp:Transcript_12223/g.25751  ORF Transcript_12223/g.25751 Transcript_12223/m.25751 type:complete len:219 (+) Transcript_12223:1332-1988(+)
MLVYIPCHVSLDQLSIKKGSAHHPSQKSEEFEIVVGTRDMTRGIDIHRHLVVFAGLPQSKIRIKNLFRHQLEPLSCQSPGLDAGFSQKLYPPSFAHIVSSQRQNGIDAISQQRVPLYHDLDVSLFPRPKEVLAYALAEPLDLFVQALALNAFDIRVGKQGPALVAPVVVLVHVFGVHDTLLCRNQGDAAGAHAGVVSFQVLDLAHVRRLSKIKGFHVG